MESSLSVTTCLEKKKKKTRLKISIALLNSMTIFMILLGGFKGFLWTNRCGGNVYVYLVKNKGNIFSSERWKWLSWAYVASMGLPGAAAVERGRFKPSKTPVFISQTDVTLQSLTFGNRSTLEGQKEQRLWKPRPFFLLFKFFKGLTIFFFTTLFLWNKIVYFLFSYLFIIIVCYYYSWDTTFKVLLARSLTAPGHTLFFTYFTLLQHLYS